MRDLALKELERLRQETAHWASESLKGLGFARIVRRQQEDVLQTWSRGAQPAASAKAGEEADEDA